jgi:hypothetical protein
MNRMSERETVVELPFAADCCPCVKELRTGRGGGRGFSGCGGWRASSSRYWPPV